MKRKRSIAAQWHVYHPITDADTTRMVIRKCVRATDPRNPLSAVVSRTSNGHSTVRSSPFSNRTPVLLYRTTLITCDSAPVVRLRRDPYTIGHANRNNDGRGRSHATGNDVVYRAITSYRLRRFGGRTANRSTALRSG